YKLPTGSQPTTTLVRPVALVRRFTTISTSLPSNTRSRTRRSSENPASFPRTRADTFGWSMFRSSAGGGLGETTLGDERGNLARELGLDGLLQPLLDQLDLRLRRCDSALRLLLERVQQEDALGARELVRTLRRLTTACCSR